MIHDLSKECSLLGQFVAEIRDVERQRDRDRFRKNMQRIGEVAAYEISKTLPHVQSRVTTPLGEAPVQVLECQPVLATILRAGLALHQGLLNYFDQADCAYISAYRKHHAGGFDIKLGYVSCPSLENRIVIVSDPMLATGSSMVLTLKEFFAHGTPSQIHIVAAVACEPGIEKVVKALPQAHIWAAAIDKELNDRAYIVPGLGDAGDLAFGPKVQN